jgi:hypothetical protein
MGEIIKTPYTLKLHESYWDKGLNMNVVRVPTGWLYHLYDSKKDELINPGVFVPWAFKREFKNERDDS